MTSFARRVYDLLAAGASRDEITAALKIPPSRLRRILNSPSYRKEAQLEGLVTGEKARLGAIGLGFLAIDRLIELTNGKDENSARQACIFALDKALNIPAPEEVAQAQSLIKTTAALVKLTAGQADFSYKN